MLGILLMILKIIGIVLLCILGLVIGIVLIVLLVPIRYEAKGEIYEEYDIKVKVHWLLHLLHVVVQLRGKVIEVSVRILGIKLFSMKKEPEEQKEDSDSEVKAEESSNDVENSVENHVEQTPTKQSEQLLGQEELKEEQTSKGEIVEEENHLEEQTSSNNELDTVENSEVVEKCETNDKPEDVLVVDDRTFSEKIEDKLNKIADAIADKCENIEKTIEDLQDKIEDLKRKIDHYLNLLSHEKTQRFLKKLFKEIGGVFVHIAPKKLKTNLHIGMEDPSVTGQICMYAAMLYPIYKNNIQIEPDFEEKVFEGTFSLKGRIRLGHFVAMVLRLVINKDFWYIIMHIKPKQQKKSSKTKSNKNNESIGG